MKMQVSLLKMQEKIAITWTKPESFDFSSEVFQFLKAFFAK
jgi:hypothetical protein